MIPRLLLLFLLLVPKALCAAESPLPIVPEGEIVEAIEPILESLGSSLVNSVLWSPDGRRLTSGISGGSIRIWDVESGREVSRLVGHGDQVWSVSWSPDGRRLASGSDDKTVRIWDVESGHELHRLEGHGSWVRSVSWNSDGHQLASGSDDRTVRIWDVESGRELHHLEGHGDRVRSVS
jgi:WD40 repeat protein